ncbi:MAG TPA: 7-carboxy-7-deazaguanine synthase [Steroidobacteraceae bacterium]|nr:7-carboxy-7-deazaguanine synthase [Steroidobacteraceae bacterium]
MSYAVKEIFYTLQGEGAHAGRPAVFLRFAGCNLWTGLERDRGKGPGGCSRWCDTDFVGTDGPGGGKFASPEELVQAVARHWPASPTSPEPPAGPFVVCTGGEPLLQLDEPLLNAFAAAGWFVAVETNGTVIPPAGKLWLTVSPKANAPLQVTRGNELKLVFPQVGAEPERFTHLDFEHFFLQPMDSPERQRHTQLALQYCLKHPRWRLSLQTHKIIGIP